MIPLHPDSYKLIHETFSKYTQIHAPVLPRTIDDQWIALHIYPYKDTISNELQVFKDSLLCTVRVYLDSDKTYYELSNIDDIYIEVPNHIRIFKDGSTMIIINAFNNPITMLPGHMLMICKKRGG